MRCVAGTLKNRDDYTGHEAYGRTIGIIGLGNVGTRIAQLAGGLFRCRSSPTIPICRPRRSRARRQKSSSTNCSRSDFVSINCPLTDETRDMMGAREYALMQPDAYFITTARGFIHDEEALEKALRDKNSPAPASTSGRRSRRRPAIR